MPPVCHRTPGRAECSRAAFVGAVVVMVRATVTAEAPVMLTGLLEPKLSVGTS
jgi:hypothetical protein